MELAQIEAAFTGPDGYHFARWGRPIVPVLFGVEDASLGVLKGAIEAVVLAAGHRMAETDPELGANLMLFFVKDWDELRGVADLDRIVPELATLVPRLKAEGAAHYRLFRFDPDGTIKACFVFLNMGGDLAEQPAADLGVEQAVKAMLLWSPEAFAATSPLAIGAAGAPVLRGDIAALLGAAYDKVMPGATRDPSHALRLMARTAKAG